MKKYVPIIISLFIGLLLSNTLYAEGAGSTSANFLKTNQGVRAIAMGETYVGLGDGLDTLNWNPAGLVQLESPTANFSHTFWYEEIGVEYISYGMPIGPLGTVAGGVTIFHAGTVTETLEDDQGNYAGEGSQISPMSFALIGGYSQKLSRLLPVEDPFLKKMIIGANLKLVTESLDDITVFGGAIDVGILWKESKEIKEKAVTAADHLTISQLLSHAVRDQGWRFGLVAQNVGLTSDKAMPINLKLGVGYVAPDLFSQSGKGTLAVDLMIPNDNDIKVTVGGEYAHISPHTMVAVRLGYKIGSEISDLDAMAGFTTGFGVDITAQLLKYQLDYAFVPYGELGSAHRLAFTLAFLPSNNPVATIPMPGKPIPVNPAFVSPTLSSPMNAGSTTASPQNTSPKTTTSETANPETTKSRTISPKNTGQETTKPEKKPKLEL